VGRKPYSLGEAYIIYLKGIRTAKYMRKEKEAKRLDSKFIERIMLAVTNVNGCEMCSYAHTRMALEQGMSSEEIKNMLQGEFDHVPEIQIDAILFAQHYADRRGNPSQASWERIVEVYGKELAFGILGAIRIIMIGNAFGIPLGSFLNRFRRKKGVKNNLFYEVGMLFSALIYTPIVLFHSLFLSILRKPLIKF
jgi:AhpD family alkylhydroperoxidase